MLATEAHLPFDIKLGDCFDLMGDIPDKSIDLIICDLPYGTTRNKWDTPLNLDALWQHYRRVIKPNGAVLLFAQMPFSITLGASNIKNLRYELIWHKTRPTGFLNANKMPLKAHEQILVFYERLPTFNQQKRYGFENYDKANCTKSTNYDLTYRVGTKTVVTDGSRCPIDVLEFSGEGGLHPTQKPVPLLEWLIKTYSNEGETILDNCMGSGSTGVAAINLKRRFIGMELDAKYFDIARARLEKAAYNVYST